MQGTVLADRYRLEDWLGGGSMGDVWLAEDEVLGRRVAVKVVKPALLEEDGFAERFHAEARVMAQLRHPGIVGVYDYGHDEADGRRSVGYLVMELIDGEPLSAVLDRAGALPVGQTLRMALQVLEALQAAHDSGIVHRDIKPANLMVREDRTVIADFGIARPGCDARLTVPGMVLGTAAYQAPEQASTGTVTASADLYALGVVLHECLSGRLPFDGETALEVILKHLTEPVPPLPEGVPAPVEALIRRAMAKEAGERWPDAASMAEAVQEALAGLGEDVPHVSFRPRPTAAVVSPARPSRAGRRVRALVGVTVLTLLCVAGAAGATVIRPGQEAAAEGPAAVAEPAAVPTVATSAPASAPAPAVPPAGPSPAPGPTAPTAAPAQPEATTPSPVVPAPSAPTSAPTSVPAAPAPTSPASPAPREPATPTAPAPAPTATSAPPTQETKPPQPTLVQVGSNGGVLDNYHSANVDGNQVITYGANGSTAQAWRLDKVSDGNYYLRNAATDFTKSLDLDVTTRLVQIWTNQPTRQTQTWSVVAVTGGYHIVNYATRDCLVFDGINYALRAATCSNTAEQVWTFS
ncbi:serine/threonine protein kinase [Streptomyces sp. NRRL WC-3742]|uniref:serine/threonine protein kinase n=1 Tax=Streptomyces sp. NRRL WC-3742 TaxID=1463934 RepID=UPI00068C6DFB|nr:protein kinase [Streptomyces sp. NRRL WC-3742]